MEDKLLRLVDRGESNLRPRLRLLAVACLVPLLAATAFAGEIPIGSDGSLTLDSSGAITRLDVPGSDSVIPRSPLPCAILERPGSNIPVTSATETSSSLRLAFGDGSQVQLRYEPGQSSTLFRLESLDLKSSATSLRMFRLPMLPTAHRQGTLNAALSDTSALALMAGSPEVVVPGHDGSGSSISMQGVTHSFIQTTQSRVGRFAARFSAASTTATAGWAMQGSTLTREHKLQDISGVAAWVHGDGRGEFLKFQLLDEKGGARDYYLAIDFTGWREVVLSHPELDITTGKDLASLYIYYNGIAPNGRAECLVDDVRVVLNEERRTSRTAVIADFEDPDAPWWTSDSTNLELEWDLEFVRPGDSMAVLGCRRDQLFAAIREMEQQSGMLVPKPGGVWNKAAPAVHENYLFLTSFSEDQFDEALALAKRGGFRRVLLGQESWCQSTGHDQVNRHRFPGGLPSLVRTVERFRANGIDVGLHVLGASIDNNDPYLTPVPDRRLVKDAQTTLTANLDPASTSIAVAAMPDGFPAEDGGYNGNGSVLQIGDELIQYTARTTTRPYLFTGCKRGYLGTKVAAHKAGTPVHHLARSFGYHLFDMNTTLLDEVTSNFATVANACRIGMVYFDGSERLQGPHSRYNARLINAYLSKLRDPNILVQASSFTHFSWHQLARSASADGHGDLKGYLEQRAGVFDVFRESGMPLDIGWYYGYDVMATPDQYEYILAKTLAYGASFSYQVSVPAARVQPFTAEILDLVKRYDSLRESDQLTTAIRQLLQVAKPLRGRAPEEKNRPLDSRRDYRLLTINGQNVFQRVIYGEWEEWQTSPKAAKQDDSSQQITLAQQDPLRIEHSWNIHITTGPVQLGFQLHSIMPKDSATTSPQILNPQLEVAGQQLPYRGHIQPGQYLFAWPGEAPALFGPEADKKTTTGAAMPTITLPPGDYVCRFSADLQDPGPVSVRARTVQLTPEHHRL